MCVCGQILKIKEWGKGETLGAQESEPRLSIIYIFGLYWMVKGGWGSGDNLDRGSIGYVIN